MPIVATYSFTIDEAPSSEDVETLSRELTVHAIPYTGVAGFREIAVFMRDEKGTLVGGVWGYVNWNWLWIGRHMMEALESTARERGCRYSHLDTFSFQARPFYEGLGYEVFATLDDYPPGHQRFFMKKALV